MTAIQELEYREHQARVILSGFDEPLKSELNSIFNESSWDMLTIVNTHLQVNSILSTRQILKTASQLGLHPQDICNVIGR